MNNPNTARLRAWLLPLCCALLCALAACSDDEPVAATYDVQTLKVAVLMEPAEQARWERTARWALDNIAQAQQGLAHRVQLQLEFYNQDADDIENTMHQIAADTTIAAVVGPTTSPRATLMAQKLNAKKAYHKPMITPSATGTEYQRTFANTPFVWNLAESNIAQLEVLIAGIASHANETSVALLTADEGNDFEEWFGFIAEEYGLNVEAIHLYQTDDDLRRHVRQLCSTHWQQTTRALIFNPSSADMALAFDDEIANLQRDAQAQQPAQHLYIPNVYCTDAFVSEHIASTVSHTTYQGVDLYARPESGFSQAYTQHFGQPLTNGEAQFYDALCLLAYAATLTHHTPQTLNDALHAVVAGRDGQGSSWLPHDMQQNFQQLAAGTTPDIDGVSSTWTFDTPTHTTVLQSTFRRWILHNHQFITTEYVSTQGSKRTTSTQNLWDWTTTHLQQFQTTDGNQLTYPPLHQQWALLIAASKGWENYRFQADVAAMYHLLKQHGYTDDHIILISEDDLAHNPQNPEPGIIRVSDTGDNLYQPAAIDYKLSDLTPADLAPILQGQPSQRLPHVINADDHDNILIFWSGHGTIGGMDFGEQHQLTYPQMHTILTHTPHRKILLAIESCYSGGLGTYCTGLPGTLLITAASPYETSHADVWSKTLGVYRSNGFTRGFQTAITQNPNIKLRDLYYTLAQTTTGSHVKVYNTKHYGSLYDHSLGEFIIPTQP